ncbi:Golgi to ER traffic protein 4 like [Pseudolycoriella hygida]|uniref:Golgi to ER traffic protein 4 like n=1 Tax=Pseudolycoriella hygida TaxID=35572 RepID=A0A9Q0RZM9_9DIPT|nr:Golgi to ER traffic protein 4 like [Pseudolycoriella hygida]
MENSDASESKATARGGVNRVLAKLELSIQSGNYYEAHQMYRTLYFRYLSQKRYDDCLELLFKGAMRFLVNEQYGSGADLGLLVVDTLEKAKNVSDYELWIQRLGLLISKINPNIVERETLLARSVKWSSDVSNNKMGHPLMHKLIAHMFWTEENLEQARHHYLLSRDGTGCGKMLIQLSQSKGYPSETDLFIAQVVLQQLCLKEKSSAVQTFETFTKHHPVIAASEPPFKMPLLNFVFYLLKLIDTGKLNIFRTLCDLYKPSIARDPSYEKYLQKIAVFYFNAPPPQSSNNSGGGLFADLINQFFQGFDDDDEDNNAASANTNAADVDLD